MYVYVILIKKKGENERQNEKGETNFTYVRLYGKSISSRDNKKKSMTPLFIVFLLFVTKYIQSI